MLGNTGLTVTEMCFGALPMGPLQADLPREDAVSLLQKGLDSGIRFVDTAESYRTQSYVGEAIRRAGLDEKAVVVATKSAVATYEEMEKSVLNSLLELGLPYIHIYHLHAARVGTDVFTVRAGALQCLKDYKAKGKIQAVGISTHSVEVADLAAAHPDIDVVYPLINRTGMGILAGSRAGMEAAIHKAAVNGKGLYAMKALSGGHLIDDIKGAFQYVRDLPVHAVSVGMVHPDELAMNLRIFTDSGYEPKMDALPHRQRKHLMVMGFCIGCGRCVEVCPNHALSLENGKAVVDHGKCILCGYCSPGCPMFALRLI
jgi:predicted aldo/keto reductase-like oxidoreductase